MTVKKQDITAEKGETTRKSKKSKKNVNKCLPNHGFYGMIGFVDKGSGDLSA